MKAPYTTTDSGDGLPLDLAIQRCADGELSDAQERELLARLEFQPEGWRRLALSFVENRVLGAACREWGAGRSSAASPAVVRRTPSRAPSRAMSAARWLAISLAVLLAFAAGRNWRLSSDSISHELVIDRGRAIDSTAPDSTNQKETAIPPAAVAGVPRPAARRQPVMYVNLELPGEDQGVPVPVYSAPEEAVGWQPFARSGITPAQADRLRREGYQVSTAQHLLRAASPNGMEILLPVEAVNILPARY